MLGRNPKNFENIMHINFCYIWEIRMFNIGSYRIHAILCSIPPRWREARTDLQDIAYEIFVPRRTFSSSVGWMPHFDFALGMETTSSSGTMTLIFVPRRIIRSSVGGCHILPWGFGDRNNLLFWDND